MLKVEVFHHGAELPFSAAKAPYLLTFAIIFPSAFAPGPPSFDELFRYSSRGLDIVQPLLDSNCIFAGETSETSVKKILRRCQGGLIQFQLIYRSLGAARQGKNLQSPFRSELIGLLIENKYYGNSTIHRARYQRMHLFLLSGDSPWNRHFVYLACKYLKNIAAGNHTGWWRKLRDILKEGRCCSRSHPPRIFAREQAVRIPNLNAN